METTPVKPENAITRYRKSDKCKAARQKYYDTKGKETAKAYYEKNKEKIIARSKERYAMLKNNLNNDNSDKNE